MLRLTLAAWLACSVIAQHSPRIVNGQTAVEFSLPYQVSLSRRASELYYWDHTCGGSLIQDSDAGDTELPLAAIVGAAAGGAVLLCGVVGLVIFVRSRGGKQAVAPSS